MKKLIFYGILIIIFFSIIICAFIQEVGAWIKGISSILFIIPSMVVLLSTQLFRSKPCFKKSGIYYLICFIFPIIIEMQGIAIVSWLGQYYSIIKMVLNPVSAIIYIITGLIVLFLSAIYHKFVVN